ncbi:MAG: phage portal protein [Clostridium sp.]|uniref:phage portal protein n=1 Tax=Clostridium sp. TaxID=1506 RepID=UPI003F346241
MGLFWSGLEKRDSGLTDINDFTLKNLFQKGYDVSESNALKESTYFKCIKYISESVAKCPIILKQDTDNGVITAKKHRLYNKLRLRPNPYMSGVDCIRALVSLGEHNGVGGLWIDRETMDLYPARVTQITIDNLGIINKKKKNSVLISMDLCGQPIDALEQDVILYKPGLTWNGIETKSNRQLLTNIINTNVKGANYLNELFDNGLTNKIVIQASSDIKDRKALKELQNGFDKLYSLKGRVFTVPVGYNASALNLNLTDVQFEQIRKLSRREIANCFGLSPAQIGDLEDSNNNNMEMQNANFLNDTLLIKFEQIEQELDWKYLSTNDRNNGFKCRFNQSVMLRTDAKTQAEIICQYLRNGAYSLNKARDILGEEHIEDGDDILVPSGYYKYKDLSAITLSKGGGINNDKTERKGN